MYGYLSVIYYVIKVASILLRFLNLAGVYRSSILPDEKSQEMRLEMSWSYAANITPHTYYLTITSTSGRMSPGTFLTLGLWFTRTILVLINIPPTSPPRLFCSLRHPHRFVSVTSRHLLALTYLNPWHVGASRFGQPHEEVAARDRRRRENAVFTNKDREVKGHRSRPTLIGTPPPMSTEFRPGMRELDPAG